MQHGIKLVAVICLERQHGMKIVRVMTPERQHKIKLLVHPRHFFHLLDKVLLLKHLRELKAEKTINGKPFISLT
jgi:hypothetical protein